MSKIKVGDEVRVIGSYCEGLTGPIEEFMDGSYRINYHWFSLSEIELVNPAAPKHKVYTTVVKAQALNAAGQHSCQAIFEGDLELSEIVEKLNKPSIINYLTPGKYIVSKPSNGRCAYVYTIEIEEVPVEPVQKKFRIKP